MAMESSGKSCQSLLRSGENSKSVVLKSNEGEPSSVCIAVVPRLSSKLMAGVKEQSAGTSVLIADAADEMRFLCLPTFCGTMLEPPAELWCSH